jgi:hypothetical protein
VVTTGATRMKNLMRQARQVAGAEAGIFLFTTFNWLESSNVLLDPIWRQVGGKEPGPLLAREQPTLEE